MSWHAVEAIDKAIEDTKELLLPFDLGTWLRLALIVIFTGGGIGAVNPVNFIPPDMGETDYSGNSSYSSETGSYNTDTTSTTGLEIEGQNAITGLAANSSSMTSVIGAVLGLLILGLVALLFYISSVFEFVYYQSLLDKDVSIRENFRKHWLKGLRYFGFNIVYLLLVIGLVLALAGGFMINPIVGVFGLLLGLPVFILLAVFSGLVHDFVLLQMIESEKGLISSWRSIWPDIRNQWREVVVYLIVKFGIGIAISIAVITSFVALLIPFIIIFGILAVILGAVSEILVLLPLIVGILAFSLALIGITIVTRTFVYFFVVEVYDRLFS